VPRRAARPHLIANHSHHHLGVAVAPGGEQLIDVHKFGEQAKGGVQDGFVPIKIDKQGGDGSVVREPTLATGH
jgi:hypothetical protein